ARHRKIWLTLKWLAYVVDSMRAIRMEFDNRQNEVFRLVERVKNLILCDSNGICPCRSPLDLQETQSSFLAHSTLNVVAQLLQLAVLGIKSQGTFNFHDYGASSRSNCLIISGGPESRNWLASHGGKESYRNDQESAQNDRWKRGDLAFES